MMDRTSTIWLTIISDHTCVFLFPCGSSPYQQRHQQEVHYSLPTLPLEFCGYALDLLYRKMASDSDWQV